MVMTKEEFADLMRSRGYVNDRARDGLDRQKLALELGRTYHAVRNWLNGTNPVPKYAITFLTGLRKRQTAQSAEQHIPGIA